MFNFIDYLLLYCQSGIPSKSSHGQQRPLKAHKLIKYANLFLFKIHKYSDSLNS